MLWVVKPVTWNRWEALLCLWPLSEKQVSPVPWKDHPTRNYQWTSSQAKRYPPQAVPNRQTAWLHWHAQEPTQHPSARCRNLSQISNDSCYDLSIGQKPGGPISHCNKVCEQRGYPARPILQPPVHPRRLTGFRPRRMRIALCWPKSVNVSSRE